MTIKDIREHLEWERQQLDKALATLAILEERQRALPEGRRPGRRGRRFMGHEERAEVSRRMKQYWAEQRKGRMA